MADEIERNPRDYSHLAYHNYDNSKEFSTFFIDKKALPEIPITGIQYVFFTAPELGITRARFDGRGNYGDPNNFYKSNQRELKLPGDGVDSIYDKRTIQMLSGESGPFMHFLTNRASSLPASAEVLDTLDYSETWNKYKIPIGTNTKDSKISGNFEILYKEDPQLNILKAHKLWYDYIEGVFMGRVLSPYACYSDMGSTQASIIDYMSSVYTFSLRPDGKTIQHWSKYTGVFPTKNPYDLFAAEDGDTHGITKVPIDYQFAYKEDMDIAILRDFNLLGLQNKDAIMNPVGSFWDGNNVTIGGIGSYPGIAKVTNASTGEVTYELRLQEPSNIYGIKQNF